MTRRTDKQPWGKFFWADWLSDPKLKLCSLSAQGLWMRMLCIAAEAQPVGYVVLEGNALGAMELAAESGKPLREVTLALAELQRWGVFSTDRRGRMYSRRMVEDVKKARTARENGRNGGNPALGKDRRISSSVKGEDKPQKPEARSRKTPKPPRGASVDLKEWKGDPAILAALSREHRDGAAWALTYLAHCREQHVPIRALVTSVGWVADGLNRDAAGALRALGLRIVLEAAA